MRRTQMDEKQNICKDRADQAKSNKKHKRVCECMSCQNPKVCSG